MYGQKDYILENNCKNMKNMKWYDHIQTLVSETQTAFFMWVLSVDLLNLKLEMRRIKNIFTSWKTVTDPFVTVQSLSCVYESFVTPWTVAQQAPLSIGFPRQKYWSRPPFPSPGDLLDPEIEPTPPALAGRFFTNESPGKPNRSITYWISNCLMKN